MAQKTIFISRVSEEFDLAGILERWLNEIFGDRLRVFTGDSIPLGDQWPEKLRALLDSADAFLVLCSPLSVARPWITVEAGVAWKKSAPVIPVCHSGLQPKDLPPPLRDLHALEVERGTAVKACRLLVDAIGEELGIEPIATPVPEAKLTEMASDIEAVLRREPSVFHDWQKWEEALSGACSDWRVWGAEASNKGVDRELYPRVFQGDVLSTAHLQIAADRLFRMTSRAEFTPDLIVGLNEGGTVVSAILRKYLRMPMGMVSTKGDRGRPGAKVVELVSLPQPERDYRNILVVDAKTKTGASLHVVNNRLAREYSGAEIHYGIVLAYAPWERFHRWSQKMPWVVTFEGLTCYMVFCADMAPEHDTIKETVRPG